ncbi:MAG: arginine--tRNA ligase, partial [Clostridia bacterium]|nr:arginine--tRNA ligase [Clostridia bacterium]
LKYYFGEIDEKPEITLEFLNENYPLASKRSKTDSEFKVKAETFTLKLQRLEEPYYTIFKDIRDVSVEAIKRNYETLNCTFDLWYGESDAQRYIETTVNTFIEKGLTKESEGATIVEVKRDGEHIPIPKKNPDDPSERQLYKNPMPPVIIKKHNGGDLYATTDIATIMQRVEDFKNLEEIVYIVDKRQANHFEGVFRASKMAGIAPNDLKLTHIGYGTMNGKDGKPFKTRDGGSIKLEDIINLVKSKADEKLKQNGTVVEGKDIALQIGVSAMKFGDLSNEVSRDYVFDLDSFMSFEGKTGPYLQYTAVRIQSILNKAGVFNSGICTSSDLEKNIILEILKLTSAYSTALKDLSPSIVCNALYNLASTYSTFYNNTKILSESDISKRDSYLSLSKLVLDKLKQGLDILAIDVPEKM